MDMKFIAELTAGPQAGRLARHRDDRGAGEMDVCFRAPWELK